VHHLFRITTLALAMGIIHLLQGQQNDVPLQRDIYIDVERNASKLHSRVQTGLKPVIESRADLTNVMGHRIDSTKYYWPGEEKIWRESLFIVKSGDVRLTADPLFRFEYGDDLGDNTAYGDTNRYYHNARGFRIAGDLGPKVSFQTMFHENQAILPQYLFTQVLSTNVMSGQGRVKINERRIVDYGWSQANVSYSPVEALNIQIGHGRHFVGHGYRSVLLSDHAVSAPYVKFSAATRSKVLQYTTWHTKMTHGLRTTDRLPTGDASESLFYWMRARFDHVGLLLGRFELGLFESTIFQTIDEQGVKPFDPLELNPVIGVNTLVNKFKGPNKNLLGLDLRIKVLDKVYVYGQVAMDKPDADRYAWQAGLRIFDLVRKDIHLQVEYNSAQPYLYQNDPARTAYMHAGLPLAHPMGAYFDELVAILDMGFGRYLGQAKVNLATYHRDLTLQQNHGSDLTKPETPVLSPEGPLVQELTALDLSAAYLVNPATNLRITFGFRRRDLSASTDGQQSSYWYGAISTNLFNRYYDL
jgi:hypothetical protein